MRHKWGYSKASWQQLYFQMALSSPPRVAPLPSSPLCSPWQLCPAATRARGHPQPTARHGPHPALPVNSTKPSDSSVFLAGGWEKRLLLHSQEPPKLKARCEASVFSCQPGLRDGRGQGRTALHLSTEPRQTHILKAVVRSATTAASAL